MPGMRGGEKTGGFRLRGLDNAEARSLTALLTESRRLGFLGPGPVSDQISRSLAFAEAATVPPGQAVDLGTGGGLPGLVLALTWPSSNWLLVDSSSRRAGWLLSAVEYLGLAARCQVLCERAETVGRGSHRNGADLVTARSFGPPGPTAECSAPLLRAGGQLLVAEPPGGRAGRWPSAGLGLLGLELRETGTVNTASGPVTLSRLVSVAPCPQEYPRRTGIPFKRPLF